MMDCYPRQYGLFGGKWRKFQSALQNGALSGPLLMAFIMPAAVAFGDPVWKFDNLAAQICYMIYGRELPEM